MTKSQSKSTSKLGKYIDKYNDKLDKTTRNEIEDIFECFDKDEVKKVLSEIYFLYYLLFFNGNKLSNEVLQFLFHKIPIDEINEIIWKSRTLKEPIEDMNKIQTIHTFRNMVDVSCSVSNTFVQDIFKPEYI